MVPKAMQKQSGYSLLELMIASALGIFLIGVIVSVLSGGQASVAVIDGTSRVQENARFSISLMSTHARNAGNLSGVPFSEDGTVSESEDDREIVTEVHDVYGIYKYENAADKFEYSFPQAVFIGGVNNTGDGTAYAGTDQLLIRYQGFTDNLSVDCAGEPISDGKVVTIRFFVNKDSQLVCEQAIEYPWHYLDDFGKAASAYVAQTFILVDGVENMQVNFRADGGDFVNASLMTASDWEDINAIKLAVLANSIDQIGAGVKQKRSFKLLDDLKVDYEDSYLREVFYKTIAIRSKS
jgi:Tfp pilus assembly protein PilW